MDPHGDDVKIRPATNADHDAFVALNRDIHDVHVGARPDLFRPSADVRLTASEFAELLARAGVVVWLACRTSDGEAVGYLYAQHVERPQDATKRAQNVFYVHAVSVRPEHRGRGHGRRLMLHAIAHARSLGVTRVELELWSFNSGARRLYQALGFAPLLEKMSLELS
jgi:ribosomal protein S18 acetylase RimI-like enzyme